MATKKAEAAVEKSLHDKLAEISGEIGFIEFDGTNKSQNYNYASAAGVIRAINKAMVERNLVCRVDRQELHHFSLPVKGTSQGQAVVEVAMSITDGKDRVDFVGIGQGADSGDKAITKALTAAKKYALAGLLTLGWGAVDPEGDESTDKFAKSKPASVVDVAPYLERIGTVSTIEQLTALRDDLSKIPPGPGKDEVRTAYVAREKALKG